MSAAVAIEARRRRPDGADERYRFASLAEAVSWLERTATAARRPDAEPFQLYHGQTGAHLGYLGFGPKGGVRVAKVRGGAGRPAGR